MVTGADVGTWGVQNATPSVGGDAHAAPLETPGKPEPVSGARGVNLTWGEIPI
jgi:hypothetical protein